MLNPKGDEILRRFGKNVKGKSPEHYVKQKNEIVRPLQYVFPGSDGYSSCQIH